MNISNKIKPYLNYCEEQKKLNPKTIKAYKTDLFQFSEFSSGDLSKEKICGFISLLHKRFKPKTAKRKIASLKAFSHYLTISEIIDVNPFEKIASSFREPVILPKTIPFDVICNTLSNVYSTLNNCKTNFSYKSMLRDIAVLEILFATGARVSEICSLASDAVDLNNHTIKIFGKGSKERIIQIENPDVLESLKKYYKEFSSSISNSGYFFVNKFHRKLSDQSVRTIVSKYVTAAGYQKHVTPHMFRHTFATLLLEEGVDIRYIQKILGHSSITTTQIYTHVAMAKQKEILSTKHPRNKIKIT